MIRRARGLLIATALACLGAACAPGFASLRDDSRAHLAAGAGVASAGFIVGGAMPLCPGDRLLLGAGAGVGAAAAKELADAAGLGVAAWDDLGWSSLGAVLGALLAWTLDELIAAEHPLGCR